MKKTFLKAFYSFALDTIEIVVTKTSLALNTEIRSKICYPKFFVVTLFFVCGGETKAQNPYVSPSLQANENYIFTQVYQKPVTNPATQITYNSDVIESVIYYDGLGRPKQEVNIKASPNQKDIVTQYDDYGRQTKQFLPFERQTGNLGEFSTVNVTDDINTYYQNKYAGDFSGTAVANVNAYSESIFEASPLNRVLEQGAPGKDWKANPDSDSDNTIKFNRTRNSKFEVHKFDVNFTNNNTEAPQYWVGFF